MTNQVRQRATVIDEQAVVDYLTQHPGFFEPHAQLLARMRLRHTRHGATISLIERQVEVLRERIHGLEGQLGEFVRVARDNQALAEKFHALTRRLLRARTAADALEGLEQSLRTDFSMTHAALVLPGAQAGQSGFVRAVDAEDPVYRTFDSLFAAGKPRCGQIRDAQSQFLFGAQAQAICSVALIPLPAVGGKARGLLALGSADREHFQPEMSTDFLTRIGEMIGDVLSRD